MGMRGCYMGHQAWGYISIPGDHPTLDSHETGEKWRLDSETLEPSQT